MTAKLIKLSPKNQLTLPKNIINLFPNIDYFEINIRNNEVVLRPARITVQGEALNNIRKKIKKLGLKKDIIPEAIAATRAKNK